MLFSRRQVFKVICAGLLTGCLPFKASAWKYRARAWMSRLIPDDSEGPGAGSDKVFAVFQKRMEANDDLQNQVMQGLALQGLKIIPRRDEQIEKILKSQTAEGQFLKMFLDLTIECYYGSEEGWNDLGLKAPPQPFGFELT